VGEAVGVAVGTAVGDAVGAIVGLRVVGAELGSDVGMLVGVAVGSAVPQTNFMSSRRLLLLRSLRVEVGSGMHCILSQSSPVLQRKPGAHLGQPLVPPQSMSDSSSSKSWRVLAQVG